MSEPWTNEANQTYTEVQTALQTVYDALNQGQQKKLLKDANVAALFEHYNVKTAEVTE